LESAPRMTKIIFHIVEMGLQAETLE
jgi:hypothetical protein